MSKKTTTPKKTRAPKGVPVAPEATETGNQATPEAVGPQAPTKAKDAATREDLCVFAFRLTEAERDAIHKAAGPAKASKFVRALTTAAARGDVEAVTAIVEATKAELAS